MLFEPLNIKNIVLKNRLIRSATYEKLADKNGYVTSGLIKIYEALASGGIGLIITGNALVHPSGMSVPQILSIHNDSYIAGLKTLTNAVHNAGGTIFIQLVHGGRQCYPELLGGKPPIAPSAVFESLLRVMPKQMTEEEVWEIIAAFGESAHRAKEAGFDGIQIHGAHGYLVSEFLSSYTNKRNDYWGGDENRRFHFVEKLMRAVRNAVGNDYPVIIKMNAADFINGGLEGDESLRIAKRLEEISFDAVEVSGGMYESDLKPAREQILKEEDEAYFRAYTKDFKKLLNIPVILVGGIRSKNVAEAILKNHEADFISMSRPLIREPDLPNKFKESKEKADCISCNGCMRFRKLDFVKCIHEENK
ncbi:MAG: NADH:flavin oxidoreductase [Candidatus Magnetoovum sp. WYHC-5]|nr:NADH:flavin oxidoreductase [Candidatus Magnetoovum sp. WYHC-5]